MFCKETVLGLGLDSGYTMKYGLSPRGCILGSGHISTYIPPLVLIRVTGVRKIGPIGIGEVQMTTILYRQKSKKSEKKWFSFGDWMGI